MYRYYVDVDGTAAVDSLKLEDGLGSISITQHGGKIRIQTHTHRQMAKVLAILGGGEFDEDGYDAKHEAIPDRHREFELGQPEVGKTYAQGYLEGYEDGYDTGAANSAMGRHFESELDSFGNSAKFLAKEFLDGVQFDYNQGYEDGLIDGFTDGEYPSDELLEEAED